MYWLTFLLHITFFIFEGHCCFVLLSISKGHLVLAKIKASYLAWAQVLAPKCRFFNNVCISEALGYNGMCQNQKVRETRPFWRLWQASLNFHPADHPVPKDCKERYLVLHRFSSLLFFSVGHQRPESFDLLCLLPMHPACKSPEKSSIYFLFLHHWVSSDSSSILSPSLFMALLFSMRRLLSLFCCSLFYLLWACIMSYGSWSS